MYELGQTLSKLRGYSGEPLIAEMFTDLMRASGSLGTLEKGDPLPVGVSKTCLKALESAIDEIIHENFFPKDAEGNHKYRSPAADARLSSWECKRVITALDKFEAVFAEEMRENATYFVPRRGIFFTKALVDAADETFPAEISELISEKTKTEWRAAGRCLAFNLLSASGFHVARAVEAQVEEYYQYFCGKGRDATLHGWKAYLDALEKVKGDCVPNPKTLAELAQMKDDFRNPVVHPRIVLSEADARMLYNNGESLIIGMAQDLAVAKKSQPDAQASLLGLINSVANEETKNEAGALSA
jgi:hypothetical protein